MTCLPYRKQAKNLAGELGQLSQTPSSDLKCFKQIQVKQIADYFSVLTGTDFSYIDLYRHIYMQEKCL